MSEPGASLVGLALIADGDPDRGKGIAEACAMRGLSARFAAHGAEALEAALAEPPDVVVAALGLPLVDAPRLAGILRSNPRTQGVRFLLVGGAPGDPLPHPAIDARIPAPVDPDAVLRRIEAILVRDRRGEGGGPRPTGGERDLEGKLAQLALADLLQLFHGNRKTGTVELLRRGPDGGEERGLVAVVDGNVADARCGAVRGEKALHRLLGWRNGSFAFLRTRPGGPARIHTPTRALLLEGMRQLDELARLRAELPSLDAEISLCVRREDLPPVVQPLTREVLGLLEAYPRVGDVVDGSTHPDYQVLRTLHALARRGIIRLRRGPSQRIPSAGAEALFSGAQLGRLREWAQRIHGALAPLRDARLCIVSPEPAATRAFLGQLEGLPEVFLERSFREGRFSASTLRRIGRLGPEQEVGVELFHLPTHPSCEPLWSLLGLDALAVLHLVPEATPEAAAGLLPLRRRLGEEGGLRGLFVLVDRRDDPAGLAALAAVLAPVDEDALFRLPVEGGRDARPCLAQILARLVP